MRYFWWSVLCTMMLVSSASAQTYRISVNQFVEHPSLDAVLRGVQDGLQEQGVVAKFSVHNAQGNMATAVQIASQIAGEEPDLVLAIATPSAQACAQAVKKSPVLARVPLVFTAITDPVAAGLVEDLARPGKNITGVSDKLPVDKHLALVRECLPKLTRLGVIYSTGEANSRATVDAVRAEAERLGWTVVEAGVTKSADVYQAAKSLVGQVDAIYIPTDNTVVSTLESVIKVGTEAKIPVFSADVDSVARGTVAAVAFDYYLHGKQTARMLRRILVDGVAPGEIPVERQDALILHVNLKAAKAMGLDIPEAVRLRAEKLYQ
ncbi:MAG: ABC transporter substrate-binding protein [Desulfomicrobiaceae bacterium]|nr:ABC transporter substrate-binding protein [Desulfomicrobiaceae bacterium]MDI3492444.1 putative tryptophan/tyrosine transport system substrate-binding protein [Desulfomicrobiaceae bacterium]